MRRPHRRDEGGGAARGTGNEPEVTGLGPQVSEVFKRQDAKDAKSGSGF